MTLRIVYPHWIFGEYENKIVRNQFDPGTPKNPDTSFEQTFPLLWEDVYYWETHLDPLQTDFSKKFSVWILWDSIAFWSAWGNYKQRFSTLLSKNKDILVNNFAQWGHNIGQVYEQYERYVANEPYNTVVYIFFGNDIYYATKFWDTIYNSPVVIQWDSGYFNLGITKNQELNKILSLSYVYKFFLWKFFSSNKLSYDVQINSYDQALAPKDYHDFLQKRFFKFFDALTQETKQKKQRFIVILSPAPDIQTVFQRIPTTQELQLQKENEDISASMYKELLQKKVETYNFYELGVNKKDFFEDTCCHLNTKWHQFYAWFLGKILENITVSKSQIDNF